MFAQKRQDANRRIVRRQRRMNIDERLVHASGFYQEAGVARHPISAFTQKMRNDHCMPGCHRPDDGPLKPGAA